MNGLSVSGQKVDQNLQIEIANSGLSMNILCTGNKSPVQRGFFKNRMGNLLPALRFLGRMYNFCNFVIIFFLMQVMMMCRRVTYFTNLEMIEYYQRTCS